MRASSSYAFAHGDNNKTCFYRKIRVYQPTSLKSSARALIHLYTKTALAGPLTSPRPHTLATHQPRSVEYDCNKLTNAASPKGPGNN
eukprot:2956744-Pyramimonas_sp.AAC.1